MEDIHDNGSGSRDVRRYLETLDSSQLYMEVMNPWDRGDIVVNPENRAFIEGELNAREMRDLKTLKALRGMVLCDQKNKTKIQTFKNYHDFRETMVDMLQKRHSLDLDFGKYREMLQEEDIRMKREKLPNLSREDQNIVFCQPASGMLVFTGIKQKKRALEKIGKKIVYAEKQIEEELKFPDEKTARDYIRGFARISDIARMRVVLTDPGTRDIFMARIYKMLKRLGKGDLKPQKIPYSHYNAVIRSSLEEYSPQDPISLQVMGLYGFFEDLFGESCHPIYEARFKNKMYIPGGEGKVYVFSKDEQRRYETWIQRALDYLMGMSTSTA
jgi:hypothetical protein